VSELLKLIRVDLNSAAPVVTSYILSIFFDGRPAGWFERPRLVTFPQELAPATTIITLDVAQSFYYQGRYDECLERTNATVNE